MKKLIQRFFKPKILLLIFWLVMVFISIATMPNLEQLSTDNAVSQIKRVPADETAATKMQAKWGRGLTNSRTMTIVFHNERGNITKQQQKKIVALIAGLKKNAAYFNVNHVQSVQSSQADQHNLVSPDGSTELINLAIDRHQTRSPVLAAQLQRAANVQGLTTYVTSPDLIQHYQSLQLLVDTVIIMSVVAVSLALILGIRFRSILLPLIFLLNSAVSGIATLSLVGNAANRWRWPFDQATPLWLGLTTLLAVAWITWQFANNLLSTGNGAKKSTFNLSKKGWLSALAIIALTGSFAFSQLSVISSIALIGLALAMAIIVAVTLNYALGALLGTGLQWPAGSYRAGRTHQSWTQISRFSLWQPIWAVVITLVIVVGNASLFTRTFSYNPFNNSTISLGSGPIKGNQIITDHFGAGQASPITLYLQSDQSLTTQKSLQTIDTLTGKLQHVTGVAKVTSVTQPTGTRFNQYYVNNQLGTVQSNLTAAQAQLVKTQKGLKSDRQSLSNLKMTSQVKNLKVVKKQVGELDRLNTKINSELDSLGNRTTNLSGKTKRQRRVIRNIQKDLTNAQNRANQLENLVSSIDTNQSTLISDYQFTKRTVKSLSSQLKATVKTLGQVDSNLNDSATYLKGLRASEVGKMFYIPDSAYNSQLFSQSLAANTSANGKVVKLIVTLKQAPTSRQSFQAVGQLKSVTKATLLGSPLAKAKVGYQGITITQSKLRTSFQHSFWRTWLFSLLVLLIVLWLGLRSAMLSEVLTGLAAGITLASLALTQAINDLLLQRGPLNWDTPLLSSVLIDSFIIVLAIPALQKPRLLQTFVAKDLEADFKQAGQRVLNFAGLTLVCLVPLFWLHNTTGLQIAITGVIGLLLSWLLIPGLIPGWLALTVNPPKLNWHNWFHREKGRH